MKLPRCQRDVDMVRLDYKLKVVLYMIYSKLESNSIEPRDTMVKSQFLLVTKNTRKHISSSNSRFSQTTVKNQRSCAIKNLSFSI